MMKLFSILVCLMIVGLATVSAQSNAKRVHKHDDPNKELPSQEKWEMIQIGFGMGFPESTQNSNVYGWKIGLPFAGGKGRVFGLESSIFGSTTDHVYGLQAAVLANVAEIIEGVQMGLVNIANVTIDGVQFGLVNYSRENAFQVGLVNILPEGPIPFFPVINFYLVSDFRTYQQDEPAE